MLASSGTAEGVGVDDGDAGGVVAAGASFEADVAGGMDVEGGCGDGDGAAGVAWPQAIGVIASHVESASVVSNIGVRRESHDNFLRKLRSTDWVVLLTGVPLGVFKTQQGLQHNNLVDARE